MRLVGLPGETIYLQDGALWVNDRRLEPPSDLAGLRYANASELGFGRFGNPDEPMRLGPDEFFVLGDFTERSSDSRTWGAVPRANVEGVVSLCYWPVERWRLFR
jgi:signal peptidase I